MEKQLTLNIDCSHLDQALFIEDFYYVATAFLLDRKWYLRTCFIKLELR